MITFADRMVVISGPDQNRDRHAPAGVVVQYRPDRFDASEAQSPPSAIATNTPITRVRPNETRTRTLTSSCIYRQVLRSRKGERSGADTATRAIQSQSSPHCISRNRHAAQSSPQSDV